eukprot:CAMPEP_0194232720 /NCGR_PEP_ID=MMETSP0158-20130606/985_1 /TAXON_ID=33649 /ORGANISM="Thalassionema nitzschioides, Strain L26-B" /LENGTH=40 /DNA_ID= /DNA_START= /DNA_END= /DNA_ORIENTATION=
MKSAKKIELWYMKSRKRMSVNTMILFQIPLRRVTSIRMKK